jgi:hypothetical protein
MGSEVIMDARQVPAEEVIGKCSWCGKEIPDDTPVFAFGGKKRLGADVSEFEGGAIRIFLVTQERSVVATVTTADSEARQDGYEFMFMVCSEECGSEMKAVLEDEVALGDALFQEIDNMKN